MVQILDKGPRPTLEQTTTLWTFRSYPSLYHTNTKFGREGSMISATRFVILVSHYDRYSPLFFYHCLTAIKYENAFKRTQRLNVRENATCWHCLWAFLRSCTVSVQCPTRFWLAVFVTASSYNKRWTKVIPMSSLSSELAFDHFSYVEILYS